MKLKPIINSLLENDLYKWSMGQCVFHQFTKFTTTWNLKCRNQDVWFTPEMVKEIEEQVDHYCMLSYTEDELLWMKCNIKWLDEGYIDFLRLWKPRRSEIHIKCSPFDEHKGLELFAKGSWLNTSMYEVPILAIVSEVYYAFKYGENSLGEGYKTRTMEKLKRLKQGYYNIGVFSEFGMRRRYSSETQDWLVSTLSKQYLGSLNTFIGSSNVHLAQKYGLTPCGTMAHEFIMCSGQGRHEYNPAYSNKFMMEAWVREYGVRNGIALTDTITTDCFLRDFNLTYATLFSGVRHDSGDPIEWGEKMIAHYEELGINPLTKTLLFSDSLDFNRATIIHNHFCSRSNVAFGIGTFLSCDLGDEIKPLNIVMKVTMCNGQPCAKISDTEGKGLCTDKEYVDYLRRCIDWRLNHERFD
ncbi:MAG: nicotinate phosphoribosyltransferase [Prevotella sp.]|nr:nicotinate phosphoribosyltransferase [Prevotella sp.]